MANSFPIHGDLQGWADFLIAGELPVLDATQARLSALRLHDDDLLPGDLAAVILRDPLFTVAVLRYLQTHKNHSRNVDITTIEHALMMLGIEPFYRIFGGAPTIGEAIAANAPAQNAILAVARRSYVASRLAQDWAARENDMESEELQVAALIHDVAEMLLWIKAPAHAMLIRRRMAENPSLRSAAVQTQLLGVSLVEVAIELCKKWGLPDLLLDMLQEGHPTPRMETVAIAVRLARHCSHGWNDPALPDDWEAVAEELGFPSPEAAESKTRPYIEGIMAKWDAEHDSAKLDPEAG